MKNTQVLSEEYQKLTKLLSHKKYAQTKRQQNPTTDEMISNTSSSTRYRRREETKMLLEYVHGGEKGAINGAWDFLSSSLTFKELENFLKTLKRGRFIEQLRGRFGKAAKSGDVALKKALAIKYHSFLSERKYRFICKIQKCHFTSEGNGISNPVEYGEFEKDLSISFIPHDKVDAFAKSIDIGEIHIIQGYSGVARTVSTLVTMIVDLHSKVPNLRKDLIWFNGNENHYIVEFSDDGAPESRDVTMSIGSLSLWNFGGRIRSREFHYPLHTVSAQEKDIICESLWKQHTKEMLLIESNLLTINHQKVTLEFQPSADQAWQCWANNVLPASATYPSPYANVHKGNLTHIGGTVGDANCTWKAPTMDDRKNELNKLNRFRKTLSNDLTPKQKHDEELGFMAEHGIRQLGEPRIGSFADRQRPDPLHLETRS